MSTKGHGSYEEVGEGEFLPAVTGSSHCVVHFYHNEFERCRRVGGRARRSAQRALNNLRLGTDSDSVVETFDDSVRLFYETSEAAPRAEPENYDIPIGLANPFGRR